MTTPSSWESADWAAGRYELANFVGIPMPAPGDSESLDEAAATFVRSLHKHAPEIDQNGLVSALYCAASQYGSEPIARALHVMPSRWRDMAWSGTEGSRLVRDPRRLRQTPD